MRVPPIANATLLVLACTASLPAGCGDDGNRSRGASADGGTSDGGAGGQDAGDQEDAAVREASLAAGALCDLLRAKGEAHFCAEGIDPESCQRAIQINVARCEGIAQAVEEGRLRYDGKRVQACVDALTQEELVRVFVDLSFDCEGAFAGQIGDGEACYYAYAFGLNECGQGLYCDQSSASCPGQCRPYQEEGDACPTDGQCAPELACLRDCTPPCEGVCGPRPKLGESCEESWGVCADDLVCDATMTPHTCSARRALGADCTQGYQCETFSCIEGECAERPVPTCETSEDCDPSEACIRKEGGDIACRPRLAAGEPCDSATDACVQSHQCVTNYESLVSVCREHAGIDGDPCMPWGCQEDHYCVNESGTLVCRPDRAHGEECSDLSFDVPFSNQPCQAGLHCMLSNTGTCLPAGGMGEPCYYNDTGSCEAGLVCLGYALSTCQPPSGLNEVCNPAFDNACTGGVCQCTMDGDSCNWSCAAKLANGDACDDSYLCLSGYCDFTQSPSVCADEPPTTPAPELCVP